MATLALRKLRSQKTSVQEVSLGVSIITGLLGHLISKQIPGKLTDSHSD